MGEDNSGSVGSHEHLTGQLVRCWMALVLVAPPAYVQHHTVALGRSSPERAAHEELDRSSRSHNIVEGV
jgi:hypothetical protein